VLMVKKISAFYPRQAVVVWQLGIAALVLSPALSGASGHQVLRAAPTLLLIGMLHTGIAGMLYVGAVQLVQAQHVSILVYLEPVTAVLWAWAVLGEQPTVATVLGGALIIAAGLLIVVPGVRAAAAPASLPAAEPVGDAG